MATEAQRLIAVSIGKIASSRGQRGGINLCKNLLVSHVLHQARTQYMMENFETMVKNRSENIERANRDSYLKSDEMNVDCEEGETAGMGEATPQPCVMAAPNAEVDKENEPPRSEDARIYQESEENMDLSDEEPVRSLEKATPCGKCTKRRLSEVGQVGDDEGSSPTKKQKRELQSDSGMCNTTTKDSTQISNLLQQFNSGLSGFLSEQDLNKESSDNTPSLPHAHSHESMSCSTQIKEAFEALSRPSIALAV